MKKIKNIITVLIFIGFVLLNSCKDSDECYGCRGVVIDTFEDQEALLFYNSKNVNPLFSKYMVKSEGYDLTYPGGYVCDTNMVYKLPKKTGGTPVIISGNGKAICGGNGINAWGYVDLKSVRLK